MNVYIGLTGREFEAAKWSGAKVWTRRLIKVVLIEVL